jgi:hypothetical protein
MRTKAKWNVEGERSSKYFRNLQKRHFAEKAIPKLILDNGSTVIFARYFQDHFPFCPFLFFERRVRNSSTTNY